MTQKMILDCDTGVDDTMAILYAALEPRIDLVAVGSVWGNVDIDTATRNCLHTVDMVGRGDIPVARGAAGPIVGTPPQFAYHVHGDDGQGNAGTNRAVGPTVNYSAAQQIIRLAREHPGEIELVAVGPLTNVALALGLDPELPRFLKGVTIMGGAALVPGNVTEVAEANIHSDPEAAAAVFNADWSLTMVGLDVTMVTTLTEQHRERLARGGQVGGYMAQILDFYFAFFEGNAFGERRSCMHDALAVAIGGGTLIPDLAPLVTAYVELSGRSRGQTVCDLRGRYMGYPPLDGARCRPVLQSDPAFADQVVELIADAGDFAFGATQLSGGTGD